MSTNTNKFDWKKPITVENKKNKSGISREGKKFQWFRYWLHEKCTLKEVAKHFGVSDSAVKKASKMFYWKERREARQEFYAAQQELLDQERYHNYKEDTYQETTNEKKLLQNVIARAGIYAGIIPNEENIELEDFEQFQEAARIIMSSAKSLDTTRKSQLRSMNQPEKINDKTILAGTVEYKGLNKLEASFEK